MTTKQDRREITHNDLLRINDASTWIDMSDDAVTVSELDIIWKSLPLAKPQIDLSVVKKCLTALCDPNRYIQKGVYWKGCMYCGGRVNHVKDCLILKSQKLLAQLNTLENERG